MASVAIKRRMEGQRLVAQMCARGRWESVDKKIRMKLRVPLLREVLPSREGPGCLYYEYVMKGKGDA